MKSLLLSMIAAMLCVVPSFADTVTLNRSSFTQTNESVYISSSGYLDAVIVGVGSSGGVLRIYNSTAAVYATQANLVSSISLSAVADLYFNNLQLRGVYYITTQNANGVTILYKQK